MVALVRHTAQKLGNCVRCLTTKRATTTVDLSFGGDSYLLRLCEQHADTFQSAMYGWARVGDLVIPEQRHVAAVAAGPTGASGPTGPTAAQHGVFGRVAVPAPIVVEEEPEEEPEPFQWPEEVPQPLRDLITAAPGIKDWRLSRKARERADEADVDIVKVLLAAEAPYDIKPSDKEPGTYLNRRGEVTAIVNPRTKTILTVFRNKEVSIRGYQAS